MRVLQSIKAVLRRIQAEVYHLMDIISEPPCDWKSPPEKIRAYGVDLVLTEVDDMEKAWWLYYRAINSVYFKPSSIVWISCLWLSISLFSILLFGLIIGVCIMFAGANLTIAQLLITSTAALRNRNYQRWMKLLAARAKQPPKNDHRDIWG